MAIVGRALRQKWASDAVEARHPERAAERIRYRAAAERALADTRAKFPTLTTENFAAADAYREARTKELMNQ